MKTNEIDGTAYKELLLGGLSVLGAEIKRINDLNVFPIPDGDTGDNMYSTLASGAKSADGYILHQTAKAVNDGMLLGARGNSGVILSQFFAGINKVFLQHERADIDTVCEAFSSGVAEAYKSVSNPVEGTMLTVLRESSDYAINGAKNNRSLLTFFENFLAEGERSVARTPDLLPVLKEAGVVDSGGEGILCIMRGFIMAMKGETAQASEPVAHGGVKELDFSAFTADDEMRFGYCTEFLLRLTKAKCDIDGFSLDKMKEFLSTVGDSIVAVKNDSIVKVHVHTFTPDKVLSYALKFGEFLTTKIENMTLQHSEVLTRVEKTFKKNLTKKPFRTIAVGNGAGLISAFEELGADLVIEGGQGRNPSVETFIDAFDAVNGDNIFVLPNNDNVIMAAQKAAQIYKKSSVFVVETRNMGEGYIALSSLSYSSNDGNTIKRELENEIKNSECIQISKTIRELKANGLTIPVGSYIAFSGKHIITSATDKCTAALAALEKADLENREYIMAFFGANVTNSEKELFSAGAKHLTDAEFYPLDAGQEIYDIIILLQ